MPANVVNTGQLDLAAVPDGFTRVDLEFHGIDHATASYSGHVYFNNTAADATTPRDGASGYVGTFHIFGHGGCFGELGHCDVHPRRAFDPRGDHPLVRARKVLIATDAVRRAIDAGEARVSVTVVPVVTGVTVQTEDVSNVCRFQHVKLITYR